MTFASLIYRALKACDGPDDLGQIISFYHNWKSFENMDIEDLQITERVKDEHDIEEIIRDYAEKENLDYTFYFSRR